MAKKILIVEDEIVLLEAYEMVLQSAGYDITLAHDGQEALDITKELEPDLILLDLRMPKMSGIEFLQNYKKLTHHPTVKIVVFSNLDADNEIQQAYELGAEKYVLKAWASPRELTKLVHDMLSD